MVDVVKRPFYRLIKIILNSQSFVGCRVLWTEKGRDNVGLNLNHAKYPRTNKRATKNTGI